MSIVSRVLLVLTILCLGGVVSAQVPNALNVKGQGFALDYSSRIALKAITVPFTTNGAGGEQSNPNFKLPANSVVIDVYTYVKSSSTTGTLSIGTLSSESGGDADGFLASVNLSAVGTKRTTLGALLTSTGRYINGASARTLSWTFTGDLGKPVNGFFTIVYYELV
jgi:hypothetical protein